MIERMLVLSIGALYVTGGLMRRLFAVTLFSLQMGSGAANCPMSNCAHILASSSTGALGRRKAWSWTSLRGAESVDAVPQRKSSRVDHKTTKSPTKLPLEGYLLTPAFWGGVSPLTFRCASTSIPVGHGAVSEQVLIVEPPVW